AKHLDYFIGVSAPLAIRLKRVIERDKITESEVMKRISRQMDEVEKMKRCDFIITNNEEEMVIPQVLSTHEKILSRIKK
nr:dephospho-CoA kinase [Chitinophagaceae bacterium]